MVNASARTIDGNVAQTKMPHATVRNLDIENLLFDGDRGRPHNGPAALRLLPHVSTIRRDAVLSRNERAKPGRG
jgi:hypothetical protein